MKRKRVKKGKRVLDERPIYCVYYLRREDKVDTYDENLWGVFYVGKGNEENGRHLYHRRGVKWSELNPGAPNGSPIKNRIIHKLKRNGFQFIEEVMFTGLTESEAFAIEIEMIAKYGRINLGTGCLANLTDGGEGSSGYKHSEEAKQKCREAKLGDKNPAFGVPKSEEWLQIMKEANSGDNHWTHRMEYPESARQKISISLIGTARAKGKRSPEACENISKGHIGQVAWNKDKKLSEEHKQHLRKPHGGNAGHNKGIKVPAEQTMRANETRRKRRAERIYIADILENMRQIEDDYGEE